MIKHRKKILNTNFVKLEFLHFQSKAQIVSVLGNIYLERECMFVRTKGKGLKEMDGLVSVFSVGKAIYRHYFKLY